jgi:hypothetical protein
LGFDTTRERSAVQLRRGACPRTPGIASQRDLAAASRMSTPLFAVSRLETRTPPRGVSRGGVTWKETPGLGAWRSLGAVAQATAEFANAQITNCTRMLH